MAFCAWCGNQVPQASYALCPRCGNHTNGAQRVARSAAASSTAQGAGLVIGLIVGGLVLVAIIGILAAIAIPNLLTALQRSRQKRTAADIRTVGTALEAYRDDNNGKYPSGRSAGDLTAALVPKYVRAVPSVDGWGTPTKYECWPAGACTSYGLASAGADQKFEFDSLKQYEPVKIESFDEDLVYVDGEFVQYPEGVQPSTTTTGGR
jgi:type II secretory pathway pseudopilin PulG